MNIYVSVYLLAKGELQKRKYVFSICLSFINQIGGLILLRSNNGAQLQFAATASFLTKLYSDYLALIHRSGGSCSDDAFSVEMLRSFSRSQVN